MNEIFGVLVFEDDNRLTVTDYWEDGQKITAYVTNGAWHLKYNRKTKVLKACNDFGRVVNKFKTRLISADIMMRGIADTDNDEIPF